MCEKYWSTAANKPKPEPSSVAHNPRGGDARLQDAQLILVAGAQPAESRGAAKRVLRDRDALLGIPGGYSVGR